MPLRSLPAQTSLRQLKNQAKDLRKACETSDSRALARIRDSHPQHAQSSNADLTAAALTLQDAQLVMAREYGCSSWPRLVEAVETRPSVGADSERVIGTGDAARKVRAILERARSGDAAVLITGEKGVGKRHVAHVLHEMACAGAPILTVNCSDDQLADSEIFGYEPGAFTGANSTRAGKLEDAAGGTLVLDEVGRLSASAQTALLRFLEDGTFHRLGGSDEMRAATRVVATTSADLGELVRTGRFREDLYYRLQVLRVDLPPLRERPEDIPELARHFARPASGGAAVPELGESALAVLAAHAWPGNVRELRHTVESAVIAAAGEAVGPQDIQLLGGIAA